MKPKFHKSFSIITKKITDPLFILGIILLLLWLVDSYNKAVINHAPIRMAWWSSAGLGISALGLISRNSFLVSSMICALFVSETIWTLSFISNLFLQNDDFLLAGYAFNPTYPPYKFLLTLYHLFILPSLIFGIYKIKKVSSFGWLGAYLFSLILSYLAFFITDFEDINCVRGTSRACAFYLHTLYGLDPAARIFIAATIHMLIFFIPINIFLKFVPGFLGRFLNKRFAN